MPVCGKAPTLAGLGTVKPVTVSVDVNPACSSGIWAPEAHYFFSNRWRIYYTATSEDTEDVIERT